MRSCEHLTSSQPPGLQDEDSARPRPPDFEPPGNRRKINMTASLDYALPPEAYLSSSWFLSRAV